MKKTSLTIIIIGLILMIAEFFRISGVNWDSNAHLHPDERFLTMVSTAVSWPKSVTEYFDTNLSPLNPHNKGFSFYVYGTYPVYLVRLIAQAMGKLDYNGVTIVGRFTSACVDLLTVIFVYFLGYYASGKRRRVGLGAALFYALLPLPIQLSHFYTVDPFVTLFSTIALYRILRNKRGIMLGVIVALAVGAKVSAILLLPIVGFSYAAALLRVRGPNKIRQFIPFFTDAALCVAAFAVTLRIVYPYLFQGFFLNERVLNNWSELTSFDGPTTSFPPGLQWINVPFWQPFLDMSVWGFGIPEGLFIVIALLYQGVRMLTNKNKTALPLFLWTVLVLVYQSTRFAKPMRYFWPIYPTLAVLMMLTVADVVSLLRLRRTSLLFAFGAILCLLPAVAMLSIYTRPNTRILATRWIFRHVPPKATIAWEHWDDPLPFPLDAMDTSVYTQIELPVFDPDDEKKWMILSNALSKSDYLIVSSNRGYGAIGRAHSRFPKTVRYYKQLFEGDLGFTLTEQFLSRPTIPVPGKAICISLPGFEYGRVSRTDSHCTGNGLQLIDDYDDETFTVYDHPAVSIFKNTRHLSADALYVLLGKTL